LPATVDAVRDTRLLVDVQCVEIGTHADRALARPAAQHADHARSGEARMHVEAERAQLVGNERRGALSSNAVSGCAWM
jgi:hypothetical protein